MRLEKNRLQKKLDYKKVDWKQTRLEKLDNIRLYQKSVAQENCT